MSLINFDDDNAFPSSSTTTTITTPNNNDDDDNEQHFSVSSHVSHDDGDEALLKKRAFVSLSRDTSNTTLPTSTTTATTSATSSTIIQQSNLAAAPPSDFDLFFIDVTNFLSPSFSGETFNTLSLSLSTKDQPNNSNNSDNNNKSSLLIDDDFSFLTQNPQLQQKKTTTAVTTTPAADFRSLQIMADELRRTSQLRMLVSSGIKFHPLIFILLSLNKSSFSNCVGIGDLESVAQVLVNSIWSFPEIQRHYTTIRTNNWINSHHHHHHICLRSYEGVCGDRTRVSYSRPIRAAARDEARLDAVKRQLAAMLRANERAHFLSLCELASAELRLAHAVDCIDVASLDDNGRIALLNCLFNLLSEGLVNYF